MSHPPNHTGNRTGRGISKLGSTLRTHRIAAGGALFIAFFLINGCAAENPKPGKKVQTAQTFQDGGPPPGTLLSPEQMVDPVPRDEPPSRYGNPVSYSVFGQRYTTMKSAAGFKERGMASWYGTKFHGRRTSSGEPYDMYAMTAAHKSLPLPTYVEVHNLENNRTAIVRVNDRGPFHSGRIIDLSYAAAVKLGVNTKGVARVKIRALTSKDRPAAQPATRVARVTEINVPLSDAPQARPATKPILLAQNTAARTPVGVGSRSDAAQQGLFLQVGAFSERDNAEILRSRMLAANLPSANITKGYGGGARTVYRLRIGPLASKRQAEALIPGLAQVGIYDTHLLQVSD